MHHGLKPSLPPDSKYKIMYAKLNTASVAYNDMKVELIIHHIMGTFCELKMVDFLDRVVRANVKVGSVGRGFRCIDKQNIGWKSLLTVHKFNGMHNWKTAI